MRIWPFKRKRASTVKPGWDLSAPLLHWTKEDPWTIRDSCAGTVVLGSTGSGKSSGSGKLIAQSMLRANYGGIILTAKPDERAQFEQYCAESGRSEDLVIFDASGDLTFNFLNHELQHAGDGAGLTENLVQLFGVVLEITERGSGGGGQEEDGYWRRASRQLLRNVIDLLVIARGKVSVPELYRVVVSAPTNLGLLRDEQWQKNSLCFQLLTEADAKEKNEQQLADFQMVSDFFVLEFPGLSEKTRSVIVSTFTSMIDVLNRGILRRLFCTTTTVSPEIVQEGKLLLIDIPVLGYSEVGQIAQVLWKHCFQRSIERREVTEETRPVMLWADECQYFLTSFDMQFATTCRGARVAMVMLTQNCPNVIAALGGGEKGKAESDSLLGNLNTKIFHCNGDTTTNQYASQLIGRTRQLFSSSNASHNNRDWVAGAFGFGDAGQQSAGINESFEFAVQPGVFCELRTGGPENDWTVDAILFQAGKSFSSTDSTWTHVSFDQRGN